VEWVLTDTTFALPNYNISTSVADDSTATRIVSNATSPTGVTWTDANNLTDQIPVIVARVNLLPVIETNQYLNFYNTTTGQNHDDSFSAPISSRDKVSAEEITGPNNTSQLLSAIQHLWRVVYAQHSRVYPWYVSANPEVIQTFSPPGKWTGTYISRHIHIDSNRTSSRLGSFRPS